MHREKMESGKRASFFRPPNESWATVAIDQAVYLFSHYPVSLWETKARFCRAKKWHRVAASQSERDTGIAVDKKRAIQIYRIEAKGGQVFPSAASCNSNSMHTNERESESP